MRMKRLLPYLPWFLTLLLLALVFCAIPWICRDYFEGRPNVFKESIEWAPLLNPPPEYRSRAAAPRIHWSILLLEISGITVLHVAFTFGVRRFRP